MYKITLTFIVLMAMTCLTSGSEVAASDALDALGYRFPQRRCSLRNLRPHYDDQETVAYPADQPVPRGWVIVGHRCSLLLIGSTTHTLLIQKLPTRPGAELTIWKCQPLPFGWAVIEEFASNQFPGRKNNVLRIRKM